MPTVRVSDKNYGYLIGVAARLQSETKQLTTPNEAIDELIRIYKKTIEAQKKGEK